MGKRKGTMNNYNTVCDKCYQGTWYKEEQLCKRTLFDGCETCGSHENISNERKCDGTLRVIDTSELISELTRYYESGERVEVTFNYGGSIEKERFYVGKSTGWKPIYIAIKKRNSSGGAGIINAIQSVEGLGIYK